MKNNNPAKVLLGELMAIKYNGWFDRKNGDITIGNKIIRDNRLVSRIYSYAMVVEMSFAIEEILRESLK